MKRRHLLDKLSGYILYTITTINKKYGDDNFINPLSIGGNGTVTYTSSNTAAATIDSSTGEVTIVAPGTSIITATTNDTLDYIYDVKDTSYTLIIAKADGNVSEAPAPQLITYDGNPHNLVSTGSGTGIMMYRLGDSGEFSTTIPSATNAGEYKVYYKANESVYYTESNVGNVTITIQKASPCNTPPTATSPIYNKTALNLLNAGSTSCGLIEYSDDEITWSTTIPQGTNAGEYTSYWRLTGDSNHNSITSTSIITTINKVYPTVTPPIGLTISYDGEIHELINPSNPGSTDYGELQYSLDDITYSTSIPTASALGDYIVYYRVKGNSNVYDIAYSTVLASIKGIIVLNPTIELEYNSCNYDGTAKTPSVVVKDDEGEIIPSNEYTVSYSNNTDAGTATVTITDVSGGTYIINGSTTFTINPINPTYTAPTAKTGLVYNCSSQLLLNSGSVTIGGTMYYSSDGINWSRNNTYSETNAGEYTLYWRIAKDNNNYNDIGPISITTTISICTPVVTAPTAKVLTYNGSAQVLANAGSISGSCSSCTSLEYSLDNSTWSSSVPNATNAKSYIVYYRVPGNSNINEVTGNIECIINAKTPSSITVELSQSTYTYNGSAKTPTIIVKDGSTTIPSSEYTINYTNNTNAGTATVTITDKSGGNYSFITLTVNFTINKATISPVVSMSGWTYEGTPTNPSITGNLGNGTVTYYYKVNSADDSTYTGTKPGSTSTATTYKVKAVIEETTNYLGTTVYTTFNISKASGRVTISGRTLTYNGNSQNLVTVSGATGTMHYRVGTSGEWNTNIPTITNKTSNSNTDSWTIYYYIDASSNYNGCGNSSSPCGNVTTTMEKITPTITAPTAKSAQAYTGSALALANAGSTNYGTLLYSLDHSNWGTSIPTATNNGTYLVYYRVEGNNNVYSIPKESPYYYTVSSVSKITEKTITATVIPEYNSTVYDKNAKTPSVTVKDGNTVISSSEYTVSYSNNTNAGTATITITDKSGGNYAVTGSTTFTITLKEVCLTWGTLSWTYDGSAHSTTCTVGCLISGDSCSATLSGNSITNKGTTTVTATGLSNSNYKLPSSGTSKTLTISARPINITAGSNSKTYDGSALTYNSATAEGTGTNRGLASGHSMTSCTVTGTITNKGSVSNVPSSAVIKNSGGTNVTSNYSINYVNGTLTINARATTVTAGSTSKTYDGSALTYNSASASNLVSGHTLSSYSCSGSITTKGSVNNVPSNAVIKSGSTDVTSNYSVSYANGTLTINARPINVTAGTTSKTYDGSALTYNSATAESIGTNRGLVSGHSMTSCTVSGSITTKGSTSNVPSGAVIKSGSTDVTSNYSINYVNGTLTINARAVTYKATDESWTYDGNSHSASNTATLTSGSLVSGHSATFSCSGSVGAGVGSATKTLSTVIIKSGSTDVSGNYSITRNNGTLKINAKSISIPTPTNYSAAYDGSAHTATFGSATGASITKYRYSTNNSSWTESTSNPSLTNVGTLYTLAYYTASTNYTGSNWSSSATITITRSKTASASAANKTYNGTTETNGTAQTGVTGANVTWRGNTSGTNAGSYTAYATPTSNFAWSDGTYAEKTITWTMNRRGQTAPVLNGDSKTFHNTATASVKTAGTVSGSTAAAPGTLTWSNLSRTALGSLTASAYYAATATNFSASSAGTATVTITCANDLSISVSRTNRTWNGSSQVIASIASYHGCTPYLGTGSSSAVSSWANANTSISATNVGTYYIWKKGTKDSNHCNDISATLDGFVTISCNRDYTIVAPTANTLTYNGVALNLLSGGSAKTTSGTTIAGSFLYSTGTWVGSNLTGNWTFTPSNSGYCTKTGSVSGAKINARTIVVTGNSASYTYDGSSRSVSGGSITVGSLGSGDTITITTSGASGTNAGSYTNSITSVVIKKGSTDVTNQYSIGKENGSLEISKLSLSNVTITLSWTSKSYNGNVQVPTVTVKSGSTTLTPGTHYTLSFSNSSSKNSGSYTITANATSNYSFRAVSASYSITKIDPTYVAPTAKSGLVYSNSSLTLYNAGSNTTAGTFTYSNGTRTGAGRLSVGWTFTPTDTTNYNTKSGLFSVTIATRPIKVTAGSTSKTYDGTVLTYNSASAESTGTNRGLVSGHSMTSCTVSGSITNVGSVNNVPSGATIKNGSTDVTFNYSITYVNGTLTVNKYTPTVTLSATNRAYNGSALYATATVSKPSSGKAIAGTIYYGTSSGATTYSVAYSGSSVNLSSVSVTNVGSITVYAYFVPNSTCNEVYNNSGNVSKTMTVSKANQSAPTATGATVVYNLKAIASASGGGGFGGIEWSNGDTQSDIGSKTTKARWKGDANHNASPWSNEVTLRVNAANFVNLRLPSGILWADRNVGATAPEGIGTFFKYGNTAAFTTSQSTYTGTENPLAISKDAARNNWSYPWRMPTLEEVEELINNTDISAVTINGRNCLKFANTSNANLYILIPCGGCKYADGSILNNNVSSHCWTSTPNSSTTSYYFYAEYNGVRAVSTYDDLREHGLQIRPVMN